VGGGGTGNATACILASDGSEGADVATLLDEVGCCWDAGGGGGIDHGGGLTPVMPWGGMFIMLGGGCIMGGGSKPGGGWFILN
jgi:hypothetical protein